MCDACLHSFTGRYTLDTNSQLQAICDEHDTSMNILQKEQFSDLSWLPRVVKEFILPVGFPGDIVKFLPV